jgi:tetratricopeptide (TPR) repeat protein
MTDVATWSISCADPEIHGALRRALDLFHTHDGDPLEPLKPVLARRPDFVFGHLFRVVALMLTSERRFQAPARASLAAAEALSDQANPRERALTRALAALVAGDWDGASRQLDRVLIDHPTDAFTLQTGQLVDFYRGDAANMRNRVARVLPSWGADLPGYGFVLGMYAFGLEECNQYADAERIGRQALAIEPRDAWAVHAVAHVMEMQGRIDEGIAWLTTRAPDWSPIDGPASGFAAHNWWHLALFHLDHDDTDACLDILDGRIMPGTGDFALGLLDATALLWRLRLLGMPIGNRMESVADTWEAKLAGEVGYFAFNDFHAGLAFAATGRDAALAATVAAQRAAAEGSPGRAQAVAAAVGLPLVLALADYAAGNHAEAAWRLVDVRDRATHFGGSHAQRDLITLTLIDAARRAGERALARHFLNERLTAKPDSPLGWRLRERLG